MIIEDCSMGLVIYIDVISLGVSDFFFFIFWKTSHEPKKVGMATPLICNPHIYRVLLGTAWYCGILWGFCRVLHGNADYCWVRMGTGRYWVVLECTEVHWAVLGILGGIAGYLGELGVLGSSRGY